ncbi:hypothetical protein [Salipaludibacillus daqingensis]|uniref:hypothetical protein n=1 Tax=Salipaludibacillus daqingensis TaxID=3041001 RepID=UPI002475FC1E|nr:hypothetical protein [Salipaludibacillus daqingensis]
MIKKGLMLFISILFLSACSDNLDASEQNELKQKLIEVNQISDIGELNKALIDDALSEASQLDLEGKDKDWFVLYYLIYATTGEEADKEKAYEHSQLRMLYEQTWQDLAFERYGVEIEEDELQEMLDKYLTPLKEGVLSSQTSELETQLYLAEKLGYSVDEYFYQITIHIYENRVISESLYPLLEKEYGMDDEHGISYQYRMEVIDEIVEAKS